VLATIGMIGDVAARIAGEHARVESMMRSGVDPHLYKATEGDVRRLSEADLILYNGLNLEGKMGDIFVKISRTRPVVAVSESVPKESLREPKEFLGHYDPHIWFDVSLWAHTIDSIVAALTEMAPEHADAFRANGDTLRAEFKALDEWVKQEIATIPKERRVLVTAHDAFGYFGRRYDIEVMGLQGISTVSEAGLGDVERLVGVISDRKIPAIFVESSVPVRAIEAVQRACESKGWPVKIGGLLFSDAMGAADTPEGAYPGMVRHNVKTIVEALR
jgi:manganese/zinc/iron transport system substrate-binding protein